MANKSRATRFDEAKGKLWEVKMEAEDLRDELQSLLGNLPENLQGGSKASKLESAIEALGEFIDACENAEGVNVDFPGRYA